MRKYIYTILSAVSLVMVSCREELMFDDFAPSKNEGISFLISTPAKQSDGATRSEAAEERVVSLRYLLADANGKVLSHCQGQLSETLDRLDINGLTAGNYSIVFLGSSSESELAHIEDPATLDDTWLQNTILSLPIEGSYFFKKIDFKLGETIEAKEYEVILDRALSRIKVEFPGIPAAVETMISSVTVTLDEGSHVYSSINADCTYSGTATICNCEVCDSDFNLTLYRFL